MKRVLFILFILTAGVFSARILASEPCELIRVVDGDTVIVSIEGEETKVRLSEIDAPEMKQPYGPESKEKLESLLKTNLTIEIKGKDVYGRTLGILYSGKKDVALEMVRAGAAWPYKKQSPEKFYRSAMYAIFEHKGIWESENPIPPWEWRKEKKND